MNALTTLPARVQTLPSVQSLAGRLDRANATNRSLRDQAKDKVGMAEAAVATQLGAAFSGYLQGRGFSDTTIGAAAGALVAAGVLLGQPTLVHAANGAAAPIVAAWARNLAVQGSRPAQVAA